MFGRGEFAQSFGTAENKHGERREAGRPFAGGGILLAHATQQVDGGGMQPVGDRKHIGVWRGFWLGHSISARRHFSLDEANKI